MTVDGRMLPGFRKRSFAMAFGGGEIWFEHLDGIFDFSDLVLEKLTEDSRAFTRPSQPSLIAVNLDETIVTDEIAHAIAAVLTGEKRFTRVVLVGLDRRTRRAMTRIIDEHGRAFALAFIDDFEKAKEWLITEGA